MRLIMINGIECLLFEERTGGTVPNKDYPYKYMLRHGESDWGIPITVEKYVLVNRYGNILSKEPFPINEIPEYIYITDYRERDEEGWTDNLICYDCIEKE